MRYILASLLLFASSVWAEVTLPVDPSAKTSYGVDLTWEAPASVDVLEYPLAYGMDSGALDRLLTIPFGETSVSIPNLGTGTWYFSIATTDTTGLTGDFSPMVSADIPVPPGAPSNFSVSITVNIGVSIP